MRKTLIINPQPPQACTYICTHMGTWTHVQYPFIRIHKIKRVFSPELNKQAILIAEKDGERSRGERNREHFPRVNTRYNLGKRDQTLMSHTSSKPTQYWGETVLQAFLWEAVLHKLIIIHLPGPNSQTKPGSFIHDLLLLISSSTHLSSPEIIYWLFSKKNPFSCFSAVWEKRTKRKALTRFLPARLHLSTNEAGKPHTCCSWGGNLMLSPGTTFAHQRLCEERGQLVCGTLPQDATMPQLLKTKAPDDAPGKI